MKKLKEGRQVGPVCYILEKIEQLTINSQVKRNNFSNHPGACAPVKPPYMCHFCRARGKNGTYAVRTGAEGGRLFWISCCKLLNY